MRSSASILRSKQFPAHLNPEDFQVSDFDDPYDAFFWMGYFSGMRESSSDCTSGDLHNLKTLETTETSQSMVEGTKDVSKDVGVPWCELADFCAFDTETSGLTKNDCVVQMAIGFFRADGSPIGFYNKLWKLPPEVKMSTSAMRVHKITSRTLERDGVNACIEIRAVHRILQTMKKRGKTIVAHNATFDVRMLKQTASGNGFPGWSIETADVFCTMQNAKTHCGLVSKKTGNQKAPSNAELYEFLSGNAPCGPLHDAVFDVKITGKSFFLGAQRGWWSV